MPGVRVVTDNACDLPDDVTAGYRIPVVALAVRFGDEELVPAGPGDFWRKCRESSLLPQTAAPAPGAFVEAFRRLAAEGTEGVVCITLASKLSGTLESARAAARHVEGEVHVEVLDSFNVSLGQGLLVLGAARLAEEGKDLGEVATWVSAAAGRLQVYADLDAFVELVLPAVPRENLLVGLVGAVVGAHAGPGVIGVAWIDPVP